jgi:hypothetical protein
VSECTESHAEAYGVPENRHSAPRRTHLVALAQNPQISVVSRLWSSEGSRCPVGAPKRKSRGSFFDTAVARSEYASSGLLSAPICSLLRCAKSSRNSSCQRGGIASAWLRDAQRRATRRLVAEPKPEYREHSSRHTAHGTRHNETYMR